MAPKARSATHYICWVLVSFVVVALMLNTSQFSAAQPANQPRSRPTSAPKPQADKSSIQWHKFLEKADRFHQTWASNMTLVKQCKASQLAQYKVQSSFNSNPPFHKFLLFTNLSWVRPCGLSREDQPIHIDIGGDVYWIKFFSNKRANCRNNRLVTVEPNTHRVEEIKQSIQSGELESHYTHVHLVPGAASSWKGRAQFYYNQQERAVAPSGSLLEGTQAAQKFTDHPGEEVEVTTVDDIMNDLGYTQHVVPFAKVSARGVEREVLLGMRSTLKHNTHVVLFEHSSHWRVSLKETVSWLDDLGFWTFKVGHNGLVLISGDFWDPVYDQAQGWHNCMAIRKRSPLLTRGRPALQCPELLPPPTKK